MNKLFLTAILIVAILLIASCGGTTETTTTPASTTTTTTTTQTTTTTSITSTLDPSVGAPTNAELAAQDFISPELPRITAERLKQFMDNGEPFVLVDTRIEFLFNMGHLPQSIDIPFQPEDEQTSSFLLLPKDRFIIFYCD
jgi:guanyl-specific ribonuclease Sa